MKDIKKETLKRIEREKIKPKPKSYFQIIKGVLYGSSIILLILAVYTVNLMFYLPSRTTRIIERAGINEYFSLFPWPLLITGAVIVGLLIYLYRNYEGGYKKHLLTTTLIIFLITLAGGGALAKSNLNESLENTPRFKRMYEWQDEKFVPKGPKNRIRKEHERKIQKENFNDENQIAPLSVHYSRPQKNTPIQEKVKGKYQKAPIIAEDKTRDNSNPISVIEEYSKMVISQIESKLQLKKENETEKNMK